jgi:Na+-driven multidrug efflux pump
MVVAITLQWFLFIPCAYVVGPVLGFGLLGIWAAQAGYRTLQACVFTAMWSRGKWAAVRL